jgi:hypothetical protein
MDLMTAIRPAARRKNDPKALLADSRAHGGLIDARGFQAGVGRNGVAS